MADELIRMVCVGGGIGLIGTVIAILKPRRPLFIALAMSAVMTAVAGFYSYPEGDPLALPVGVTGTLAAFLLWRFAF